MEEFTSPAGTAHSESDRRQGCRVPFPSELLLAWHHDLSNTVRYRILDAGDGGFRIKSSLPLLEGMTGMALKLLPGGSAVNQPVMVAWIKQRPDKNGYEIGLSCF